MRHLPAFFGAAFLLGGCLLVYDYGGYEHAGAGAAGGTGGGGATCDTGEDEVLKCNQCIDDNCGDKLSDCSASACKPWGICFDGCECPACLDACEEEPKGALGEQVVACACTFCSEACAGVKPAEYLSGCN